MSYKNRDLLRHANFPALNTPSMSTENMTSEAVLAAAYVSKAHEAIAKCLHGFSASLILNAA